MRILMLTPYLPYPLLSGGQTRSYNLLKNLKKDYEITLFSFIRKKEELKYSEELLKYCKKVEVFQRRDAWSPINISLAALSPYPFLVAIYFSLTLRRALERELSAGKYDLIHAETFYVMPNIPKTTVPILLVEQTIEYRVYQHFVKNSALFFLKPLFWFDVFKVKYWETYFWKKANRVVAMSEADRNKMYELAPKLSVDIVPNGVDLSQFKADEQLSLQEPVILYVGNFKWLQNYEAVRVLILEVWPIVKKVYPNAKLLIVGRGLKKTLQSLSSEGIVFDQDTDDIRRAYTKADVMVAPIKGPGGTRLKILEAMASGCPVVTTHVGIEGIEAQNGKEVLIGGNPKEIASLVIEILQNNKKRLAITQNARKLVEEKYNWVAITKRLDEIYQKVVYETKH